MTRTLKPGSNRRQINRGQVRIRNLERRPSIQYDAENVGEWLYIKATDVPASAPLGDGIILDAVRGVGITNSDSGGGLASLEVLGGDVDSNVLINFGGGGFPVFELDGKLHLQSFLTDYYSFNQADGSGNNSELSLNGGEVSLSATGGIDIASGAGVAAFPVDFGANSVQIAAGDPSTQGTVVLEAYDGQATPQYTEFFVGHVDFAPSFHYDGQVAQLTTGQKFTIVDHTGAAIFQVEEAGNVRIRTGHTVLATL